MASPVLSTWRAASDRWSDPTLSHRPETPQTSTAETAWLLAPEPANVHARGRRGAALHRTIGTRSNFGMDYGIVLFTSDRGIAPATAAKLAEDPGFHTFYAPEHPHIPVKREPPHPTRGH